jgi:transposase-like protein
MDETYIKVADQWKYLYRAIDKSGANTAAICSVKVGTGVEVELRQSK